MQDVAYVQIWFDFHTKDTEINCCSADRYMEIYTSISSVKRSISKSELKVSVRVF